MMRGIPAAFGLVPLEHGKVGDPEEAEVAVLECAVTLGILLRQRKTQLAGGGVDGIRLLARFDCDWQILCA